MNLLRYFILTVLITIILIWWFFFRVSIDADDSKVYRTLILKDPPTDSLLNTFDFVSPTTNRKVISSWILFYRFPQGKFFLFEIDSDTFVEVNESFHTSIYKDRNFLKENIKKYYGIDNFDFEVSFTEKQQLEFLNHYGGAAFFNLYSTNLPLGEVYISELNYTNFLTGIANPYHQKISALSFWFNLLMSFQDTLPHNVYTEDFVKNFYQIFSGNINYPTFWALVKPLLFDKNNRPILLRNRITFKFDKSSIDNIATEEARIFVPYEEGDYDKIKISDEWEKLKTGDDSLESHSISAQIKNATTVQRLASRAAGFFRLRGINIIEYLGFSTILKQSVILDYSNQPFKREYIKKISKIDKIYHLFNYRESYDFGIYLGEDLYVLQNQPKKDK